MDPSGCRRRVSLLPSRSPFARLRARFDLVYEALANAPGECAVPQIFSR